MNVLKSIGAVIAGLVVIVALSTGTDKFLEASGVLPGGALPMRGAELLIAGVLAYRMIFSILGCYITARLAPGRPMRHALALGIVGVVFSALGTIAAQGLAPAWYGWGLVVVSLPCAWIGGRLAELRTLNPSPARNT